MDWLCCGLGGFVLFLLFLQQMMDLLVYEEEESDRVYFDIMKIPEEKK